jgi:uncharacterized membrane protein YhhN
MKTRVWAASLTVVALLYFTGGALEARWLTWAMKPLFIVLLMVRIPWSQDSRLARATRVGLAFSLVGDVLLMLPYDLFVPGLIAFLLGHVAYIVGFLDGKPGLKPLHAIPLLAYGAVLLPWLWPGLGPLQVPVLAYVLVILVMGWRAAARVGMPGGTRALVGALFFIASDSLLAIGKFHGTFPAQAFLVMSTYWLGQLLITLAVGHEHP